MAASQPEFREPVSTSEPERISEATLELVEMTERLGKRAVLKAFEQLPSALAIDNVQFQETEAVYEPFRAARAKIEEVIEQNGAINNTVMKEICEETGIKGADLLLIVGTMVQERKLVASLGYRKPHPSDAFIKSVETEGI